MFVLANCLFIIIITLSKPNIEQHGGTVVRPAASQREGLQLES